MSDQTRQFQVCAYVANLVGGSNCRLRTFGPKELPAINLIPEDEVSDQEDTLDDVNTFKFHLRFIAQGIDGASAQADAQFLQASRTLAADRTLGGMVRRVRRTGRKWEREQLAEQQIALVATYECEFSTRQADPGLAGY